MNVIKTIFGNSGSRVWFIVTVTVIALLLTVSLLMTITFGDVFASLLGGRRVVYSDEYSPMYTSDYESKEATLEAANAFNERICEEGFVLLKNDGDALPLRTPVSETAPASDEPRISVFGKNSVNYAYGGSGSGSGDGQGATDLYSALISAGYDVNPVLREFYESSASGGVRPASPEGSNLDDGKTISVPTYETPYSLYPDTVRDSYASYSDAALIVITRMGGEGFDLPRTMAGVEGSHGDDSHYLQLDANESDLVNAAISAGFDRVVLILNVGTTFELGFLEEDTAAAYNELKNYDIDASGIDACIWTGFPGNSGLAALGRILNGNVNPSGRTTDTYATDFTADPSWNNFGDNLVENGDSLLDGGSETGYYFVDYEENIYVGYRYYETRGADDQEWYEGNVVYPFGYGLSYTRFRWEMLDDSSVRNAEIVRGGRYSVTVRVWNDGDIAGKDVVQLYGHAPYTEYGLQKPHKVLLGFAKTETIMPGEYDDVTLTFDPYYLASYDYSDANYNGFTGYELEPGDYELHVGTNAHDTAYVVPFSVENIGSDDAPVGITYAEDPVTGNAVVNRYTDLENSFYDSDFRLADTLVRDDWTGSWPLSPLDEAAGRDDRELGQNAALLDIIRNTDPAAFPWAPDYSTDRTLPYGKEVTVTLRDMVTNADGIYAFAEGTPESEKYLPFVSYDDIRWETLLEQTDYSELNAMRDVAAFNSGEIASIGKPLTNDTDGPAGFVNFMLSDGTYWGTCYYASQMTVASTWSEEIAEEFGRMVGNEGIWGADGHGNGMPYSGWYAPGANIHRSPFGGRNFEYMSEDCLLTGKMAAAQIRGCQSKGVYCFIKHFAVNDQETHRSSNGITVWLTEQSLREIYLRPFEIAVKEGGTRAVMSSFNRIGAVWAGGDYRLLTEILRGEWGFRGSVISDFTSGSYMDSKQMAYAGGDLNLNNQGQYRWNGFDASDTADTVVLRNCAKNIMYTVVNSNAMNREIDRYMLPVWQVVMIVVICVIVAGLAVWGVFAVRGALKAAKSKPSDDASQPPEEPADRS